MPKPLRMLLTFAAIVGFFAVLYYGAANTAGQFRCEVCVEYAGGRDCRSSNGETREDAIQGAHSAACANLASGVTNAFRCGQTAAASIRCVEN